MLLCFAGFVVVCGGELRYFGWFDFSCFDVVIGGLIGVCGYFNL